MAVVNQHISTVAYKYKGHPELYRDRRNTNKSISKLKMFSIKMSITFQINKVEGKENKLRFTFLMFNKSKISQYMLTNYKKLIVYIISKIQITSFILYRDCKNAIKMP